MAAMVLRLRTPVKADLAALKDAIDAYTPLVTKPRQAIGTRKVVTGEIGATQEAADGLSKEELDRSIAKIQDQERHFFRRIHQRPHDHRSRLTGRRKAADSAGARTVAIHS